MKDTLQLARQKLLAAEKINPGHSTYQLAACAALLDLELECQSWLKQYVEDPKTPDSSRLRSDSAFASVRDREWFHALSGEAAQDRVEPGNIQRPASGG